MQERKYIDCREVPGSSCSLKLSGTEDEVMKAAVEHAISTHGYQDTPEFREELRKEMKKDLNDQKENRQVA